MRPLEVNKNIFQNYERNRSDSGFSGECLEKELRNYMWKKIFSITNEREILLSWLQSLNHEINGKLLPAPTSCETKTELIHLTVGRN